MNPLAKTVTLALAALGLAGAGITPALAGNTETMAIKITTDDLNLATASGQKALDQRIEKAARTVCRVGEITTGTRVTSQQSRACLAKARADVKQQVAALKSRNEQRGG